MISNQLIGHGEIKLHSKLIVRNINGAFQTSLPLHIDK